MKKGGIYEGYVERTDYPNRGIVNCGDEGMAVVKNAICGQRVRFVVQKSRHGRAEGRLLEVTEHAACEQPDTACPHFPRCGGCLYQGFPYAEMLRIKEDQIRRLMAEYIGEAEYSGLIPSPEPLHYRNKMEYSFGDAYLGGPLKLGLHVRGSNYDIESVPDCRIAPEDFGTILAYTEDFFAKRGLKHYHRIRHTGILRHLLLRKSFGSGELLCALVSTSQLFQDPLLLEWCEGLRGLSLKGRFAGILHIVNDSPADAVRCERLDILYGQDYFTETILGLRFKVSLFSFFQTNSRGAERLYELGRDYLSDRGSLGTVYDLYSGTGTIAQLLSPAAERVTGVELVAEAVAAAKENAAFNGISNCDFIAGDVLKVLDSLDDKPELIVLDPPRDGVHPKALGHILSYGVERILYISCKASSLARDMEAISAAGYRIRKWGLVDMFPYAAGIELCTLLVR